jgi:predicted nucleic acid-binding protein
MEQFLFSPSVVSSFLRLVTNPRIYKQPSSISDAWAFVDWLEAHPASVFVESDAMTFGIFKHLCLASGAAGTAIPDAFLAAIALRHDASLKTMDSGMKRYKGVDIVLL